jgi:hypothetical protein
METELASGTWCSFKKLGGGQSLKQEDYVS